MSHAFCAECRVQVCAAAMLSDDPSTNSDGILGVGDEFTRAVGIDGANVT